jgi:hypothetical protein
MSDKLSSEILEEQFGETEVEVLYQDDADTRIICTRAMSDRQVLEISRVLFMPGASGFPETHEKVLGGLSMGKAFKQAGIKFLRPSNPAASYYQVLPTNFGRWFGSDEPASVVSVTVFAGSDKTPYAEILETYSPAVIWEDLNGKPEPGHAAIIAEMDELLATKATDH